jgi:hypothetical protein
MVGCLKIQTYHTKMNEANNFFVITTMKQTMMGRQLGPQTHVRVDLRNRIEQVLQQANNHLSVQDITEKLVLMEGEDRGRVQLTNAVKGFFQKYRNKRTKASNNWFTEQLVQGKRAKYMYKYVPPVIVIEDDTESTLPAPVIDVVPIDEVPSNMMSPIDSKVTPPIEIDPKVTPLIDQSPIPVIEPTSIAPQVIIYDPIQILLNNYNCMEPTITETIHDYHNQPVGQRMVFRKDFVTVELVLVTRRDIYLVLQHVANSSCCTFDQVMSYENKILTISTNNVHEPQVSKTDYVLRVFKLARNLMDYKIVKIGWTLDHIKLVGESARNLVLVSLGELCYVPDDSDHYSFYAYKLIQFIHDLIKDTVLEFTDLVDLQDYLDEDGKRFKGFGMELQQEKYKKLVIAGQYLCSPLVIKSIITLANSKSYLPNVSIVPMWNNYANNISKPYRTQHSLPCLKNSVKAFVQFLRNEIAHALDPINLTEMNAEFVQGTSGQYDITEKTESNVILAFQVIFPHSILDLWMLKDNYLTLNESEDLLAMLH